MSSEPYRARIARGVCAGSRVAGWWIRLVLLDRDNHQNDTRASSPTCQNALTRSQRQYRGRRPKHLRVHGSRDPARARFGAISRPPEPPSCARHHAMRACRRGQARRMTPRSCRSVCPDRKDGAAHQTEGRVPLEEEEVPAASRAHAVGVIRRFRAAPDRPCSRESEECARAARLHDEVRRRRGQSRSACDRSA